MLVIYERFIEIKPLEDEINNLDIEESEKENLLFMSAEIFHHHTLQEILNRLAEVDKRRFLEAAHKNQEVAMAQILKDKVSDYEEILKKKLNQVRDEIIAEIRKARPASTAKRVEAGEK